MRISYPYDKLVSDIEHVINFAEDLAENAVKTQLDSDATRYACIASTLHKALESLKAEGLIEYPVTPSVQNFIYPRKPRKRKQRRKPIFIDPVTE